MPGERELMTSLATGLLARSGADHASDDRLLTRYLDDSDQDAFAALVLRHGPMVYGVCTRVAGDAHLADDAFQAVFLLLSQRASRVRPRGAVRGWLYGVAVRTARTASTRERRRRRREVPVPAVPEAPTAAVRDAEPDALLALHEEVARLPERLRAAVVLCELSGLSRKRAAVHLGVSEGTLSSRLAAARRRLAAAMRARGFVGGSVVPAVLLDHVDAAAGTGPRSLLQATVGLASRAACPRPGALALAGGLSRGGWVRPAVAAAFVAPLIAVCTLGGDGLPPTDTTFLRRDPGGTPSAHSPREASHRPASQVSGGAGRVHAAAADDEAEPRIVDFMAVELSPGLFQLSGRVVDLPVRGGVIELGGVPLGHPVARTVLRTDGDFSLTVPVVTDGTVTGQVVPYRGKRSAVVVAYVEAAVGLP